MRVFGEAYRGKLSPLPLSSSPRSGLPLEVAMRVRALIAVPV